MGQCQTGPSRWLPRFLAILPSVIATCDTAGTGMESRRTWSCSFRGPLGALARCYVPGFLSRRARLRPQHGDAHSQQGYLDAPGEPGVRPARLQLRGQPGFPPTTAPLVAARGTSWPGSWAYPMPPGLVDRASSKVESLVEQRLCARSFEIRVRPNLRSNRLFGAH
jgi:hypothetical protein